MTTENKKEDEGEYALGNVEKRKEKKRKQLNGQE
jgi:hypothetical protein